MTPQHAGTTVTEVFDDGEFVAVVFDAAQQRVHRMSPAATAVWVTCDGGSTVDDVVHELAAVFGEPSDVIRRTVLDSLDMFAREGLLEPGSHELFERTGQPSRVLPRAPDP